MPIVNDTFFPYCHKSLAVNYGRIFKIGLFFLLKKQDKIKVEFFLI